MRREQTTWQVEVLGDRAVFTLRELCERSDVHAEFVVKLVNYGVIVPVEEGQIGDWRFDAVALTRLQKARRLQRDLKLNVPGLAVSLDLLDDVQSLRQEVNRLHQQLRQMTGDNF